MEEGSLLAVKMAQMNAMAINACIHALNYNTRVAQENIDTIHAVVRAHREALPPADGELFEMFVGALLKGLPSSDG